MKFPVIKLERTTVRRMIIAGTALGITGLILLSVSFLVLWGKLRDSYKDNTWIINCKPNDSSPILSDAEAAISELMNGSIGNCRSENLTTIIHCHKTACISLSEPSGARKPGLGDECIFYANWAEKVLKRRECRTADQLRVEGRVMVGDEGDLWVDVRVFSRVELNRVRE